VRKNATEEIIVNTGGYSAYKLHLRNEYMVDNSDKLIAVFNPAKTSGGTFACLKYAKSVGREIIYIDPKI